MILSYNYLRGCKKKIFASSEILGIDKLIFGGII